MLEREEDLEREEKWGDMEEEEVVELDTGFDLARRMGG